ncbi:hypothetical protein SELMODRAFT_411676 [Selaginella moellendorffii]|uniref:Uncharacterized protein n=1 Tax=Selaginella moellendorffii TaxID=88036 RepID=D8RIP1_SELML|nr:hypothetical protein SELMODRAFT_411676 [Selaginella moellendorffii]
MGARTLSMALLEGVEMPQDRDEIHMSRLKMNKWRTQLKTLLPHLILQQLFIPQILLPLLVQPRLLEMYEGSSIMSEKPANTLYIDVQMHSFHPSPLLQRMTSKSYLHRLHINKYEKKNVCPLSPTGSVGNVEIVIGDYFQLSNNVSQESSMFH